jgi:hypothetical protein
MLLANGARPAARHLDAKHLFYRFPAINMASSQAGFREWGVTLSRWFPANTESEYLDKAITALELFNDPKRHLHPLHLASRGDESEATLPRIRSERQIRTLFLTTHSASKLAKTRRPM